MTETPRPIHARLSARCLAAVTPTLRTVTQYANSLEAFCAQEPVHTYGLYVVPADTGVFLLIMDAFQVVVVHDLHGTSDGAYQLWLPDDLLDALQIQVRWLDDEDGLGIPVEVQPKPDHLVCTGSVALLMPEQTHPWQRKRFPGTLGSWHDRSHGCAKDLTGYHIEAADPTVLERMGAKIAQVNEAPAAPTSRIALNPRLLGPLCHAATALEAGPLHCRLRGAKAAVEVMSETGILYALVMPCRDFFTDEALVERIPEGLIAVLAAGATQAANGELLEEREED